MYIKNDNAADREMFHEGDDWEQKAQKRRLTQSGKEIYLYMKNSNKEVCSPYKYNYENVKYKDTKHKYQNLIFFIKDIYYNNKSKSTI